MSNCDYQVPIYQVIFCEVMMKMMMISSRDSDILFLSLIYNSVQMKDLRGKQWEFTLFNLVEFLGFEVG